MTVADWLASWLPRHAAERHLAASTVTLYEGVARNHLLPHLGGLRLRALRPDHVAQLVTDWARGARTPSGRPLSASSTHLNLVVLRQALRAALQAGLIPRNPLDAVRSPSLKSRVEKRALADSDISALLAASHGRRIDSPLRLALATGLREGELLGLRWEDVDFERRTLRVVRQARYISGEGVRFTQPKTRNARRTLELSEATVAMLRIHRRSLAEERLRAGPAWAEEGLVFPSGVGTPWIARNFYRDFRQVLASSGIDDPASIDFHTLRQTAASQWISRGVDIFSVSRRLGHASAAFTMDVYGHMLSGQQSEAAQALDHLIALA